MDSTPQPATGSSGPDPPAGASPAFAAAAAPDWAAFEGEIDCPLCGYSLRGLIEPRCPECGYRFDWPGIIAARSNLHPYLFEHHPERNVRSYVATFVGALRPRTFWSGLHPGHRFHGRRLFIYASIPYVLLFGLWLALAGWWGLVFYKHEIESQNYMRAQLRQEIIRDRGFSEEDVRIKSQEIEEALDFFNPLPSLPQFVIGRSLQADVLIPLMHALMLLTWPWLTFAALLVFQVSMRRARIRMMHVLRCVVYSFDVQVWSIGLAFTWTLLLVWMGLVSPRWNPLAFSNELVTTIRIGNQTWFGMPVSTSVGVQAATVVATWTGLCAAAACSAYRLRAAFRWYLQFHAPLATVAASQILALLVLAVLRVQLAIQFRL